MASRISQMRNGMFQPQPQPQPQHQQVSNEAIEQTKRLMAMIKGAQNPQAMLAQALQANPYTPALSNMLRNSGSLEQIAQQMAQMKGIDLNQLIQQLSSK